MHYESYRTFYKDQAPPERRFSRRSVLRMAAVSVPIVAGSALITKGGLLVIDLRERERNVGKLAANSGRAYEVHALNPSEIPNVVFQPSLDGLVATPLPPAPDDTVPEGSASGRPIIGRVRMPSIDVDSPLVQVSLVKKGDGYVWQTANRAVGLHENSGQPGAPTGNAVFSGHISSIKEGDVFRHLPNIAIGDLVRVTTERTFTYRVSDKLVVLPSESWVMGPTEAPIATFITCVPDGVYSHRLVVVADLVNG